MVKSAFGDRETVGTIALKARNNGERIVAGDLGRELMPQLVLELNEAIQSNPFDGRPFFIIVHEKKDLQLTNVMFRRLIKQEYRPYPEPATSVFWTDPSTHEVRFCWSLPHQANFPNYLENAHKYVKEQIRDIVAYNHEVMENFGFYKAGKTEDGINIYKPIPNFQDRKMRKKRDG
jgi:hypothetical protein